ncbi:hypothetical protein [Massilia sp. CT11-137]|uniref:hypothetical protein n=1 Tax=Massilia sp. CT11-137 TaxID=3393901 RepID=UPI0039A51E85
MTKGSLRDVMPVTAALIDEYRAVFGRENIDDVLRRARKGEPVFYAEENGHTFGTPSPPRHRVQWDERGLPYVVEQKDRK